MKPTSFKYQAFKKRRLPVSFDIWLDSSDPYDESVEQIKYAYDKDLDSISNMGSLFKGENYE